MPDKDEEIETKLKLLELAYTRYDNIYVAVWMIFRAIVVSIAAATVASMFRTGGEGFISSEALIACSIAILEFWYWGIFRSHDRYGQELLSQIYNLQAAINIKDTSFKLFPKTPPIIEINHPKANQTNKRNGLYRILDFNHETFLKARDGKFRTSETLGLAMSFFHIMVVILITSLFWKTPNTDGGTPPYSAINSMSSEFCNFSPKVSRNYCKNILRVQNPSEQNTNKNSYSNVSNLTRLTFITWIVFIFVYCCSSYFLRKIVKNPFLYFIFL